MGRDALKLGKIQRMILYCAQILYLKCISELKVDSGDRFPICLLNYVYVKQIRIQPYTQKCSLKQQYVILSVRLVVWVGVKTDGFKVSSKPYHPRVAGSR